MTERSGPASTPPSSWGAGPVLPLPAPVLGRLLERPAAVTPDAPALVAPGPSGDVRLSYAELDATVRARAAALHAAGVRAGERVGLLATREPSLVPSLLALLRLGAAYVPLDPAAPAGRWAQVVEAAGIRRVLGPAALAARPALPPGVDVLPWDRVRAADGADVPVHEDPSAAAYVLFTSGSTGTPKGVVVTHGNVLARVASYLALTDGPCQYLLHSSLCFDGAVGGMFSTLARGGCLVLPSDAVAVDPARAAELVATESVTHLEPVPSWYAALLDLATPGRLDSVRAVILGGEVLPPSLVLQHARTLPGTRLFNDYGPTETTVAATVFEVPHDWAGDSVPIGRPHANTTVLVLATDGQPARVGEVGSLVVGGPCVAAGYLGLPDAPVFGTDSTTGERTYTTGDLAAWDVEGLLHFHGRADRQVKVRGQRVEPDEVEAALAGVPGVALCAVEVDRTPAGPRLVAYASPARGLALDGEGLRRQLAARLPAYTVPDLVVVLDALPLTAGGKVDRRRLPAPGGLPPSHDEDAPRGLVEAAVAAAVADVLGVPSVSRTAGFLAAGGTSLGAARVAARLRAALHADVTVADVLRHGTPAALAEALAARARTKGPVGPVRRERPAGTTWRSPASPKQESFWLTESLPGGRGASNLAELLGLGEPLDPALLRGAVRALACQHSSLRTSFELAPHGLVQVVHPEPRVEVRKLVADGGDDVVASFVGEPFDLGTGPLARVGHLDTPEGTQVVLVVHHAVTDGWSLTVLVDDLLTLLRAAQWTGLDDVDTAVGLLPPVAIEPLDHGEWVAARPAEQVDAATARVSALLEDAGPALARLLPYDRPRPAADDVHADVVTTRLSADVWATLGDLAGRLDATVFQVIAASVGAVLARGSGVPVPLLASPVSGRGEPDLDRLVGCVVNVGLLPVDTTGDPTFAELVRRVAAAAAAAAEFQWLPLEVALRRRGEQARAQGLPVLLNLLDLPEARLELGGHAVTRRAASARIAATDLDLELEPTTGGLRVDATYAVSRLDRPTVEGLLDRWLRLLRAAVGDPQTRVSHLPLLEGDEERLLDAWEQNPAPATVATLRSLLAERLGGAAPQGPPVARIAGADGTRLPVGIAGELLVGGPSVASSTDGLVAPGGQRWLRTGLRARWRRDGGLALLGGVDDALVVRGLRVDPGEVEAALLAGGDVADVAVGTTQPAGGQAELVAWVVLGAGAASTGEDLRASLRHRLPTWLVPAAVVAVPALPRTPAGLVETDRLPQPVAPAGAPQAPAGELERRVAAVWEDLLGRPPGRDESFFAGGGHSLLAARMVARLRAELQVDLDLADVLRAPRLRDLAELLERRGAAPEGTAPVPPVAATTDTPPAATPSRPAPLDVSTLSTAEAQALLDSIDELSDAEVEELLNRLSA